MNNVWNVFLWLLRDTPYKKKFQNKFCGNDLEDINQALYIQYIHEFRPTSHYTTRQINPPV